MEWNGVSPAKASVQKVFDYIPHLIPERTKSFILMIVKREPGGNKAPGYILATIINRKHASVGQSFIGLMSKLMDM